MTLFEQLLTLAICVAVTVATRFLPFLIFKNGKPIPPFIKYLGKALPGSIFGMLVIYCLKDVSIRSFPFGLAEAISIAVTVALHLWKRKTILSIAAGTVCYMILTQFIFI